MDRTSDKEVQTQLKIYFNSKSFSNLIFQDLSPLLLLLLIAKAGGLLAKVHPLAINPATNPAENRTTKPRKAGPNRETTDYAKGRVTATTDLGRGGETARRGRRGEEIRRRGKTRREKILAAAKRPTRRGLPRLLRLREEKRESRKRPPKKRRKTLRRQMRML